MVAAIEGATTRGASAGFSAAAELVVFTANAGSLTTNATALAIGSATSAYAIGRTVLFVIDTGVSSGVFLFTSGGPDAQVSAIELLLLATLSGTAATITGDYIFGASVVS